ncbi:MAG TPA: DinB family protein [Vicinamibacterales bacterium]|nr:DinB family protein [Vicinamibacterales bacterium]
MTRDEREQLIAQYEDGYRAVAEALAGISDAELDAHPRPGGWSAREIVHHLADSEMTSAIRFRRVLAEDRPEIKGYDQEEYARRLHYDRPWQSSLEAFRWARVTTAELMACLSEADWLREGTHSEHGRYGLDTWLQIYAVHAHRHAEQIRAARASAAR